MAGGREGHQPRETAAIFAGVPGGDGRKVRLGGSPEVFSMLAWSRRGMRWATR